MLPLIIILLVSAGIFVPLFILKNKIGIERLRLIAKIMAIALFTLALIRLFLNDSFIWVINGGTYGGIYYKTTDVWQSILRWGMTFAYIVYPCAIFFSLRTLKNFAVYFCFPMVILSSIFYNDFMSYFLQDSGRAMFAPEWLRHVEFSAELILMIVIPLFIRFIFGHKFDVKSRSEWLHFFGLLPLALIIVIPVTLPQSLFGYTKQFMNPLTVENFAWIGTIFAMLIILYLAFRFKNRETRYALCVFLALYLFYHYNSIYLMDMKLSRLPFQLCNLGSYLVLIALLIKKQGFFNFIFLANVPGALIAFCVPETSEAMLSYWNIHFYIEHTWVFIIPILCVVLRIFERPAKNSIKHFVIGFSIYFVFCALSGIIINSFIAKPNDPVLNEVNYFYLFNTTVLETLPMLGFTRLVPITINGYSFYPLYIAIIYLLYNVFCVVITFVCKWLYKIGDERFLDRQIRIDLWEERGYYKKRKKIPSKFYED